MKSNRNRNIGSVSHATMREEDLIPSFISELESQRPLSREHRRLIRDIKRNQKNMVNPSYYENEQCTWDLEALFDALDSYSLPYFYFGAHPGDGSDYGYWLSEGFDEEFADASTTFAKSAGSEFPNNIKVNDLADVPQGFTGEVLLVNDHGNCSLYAYNRGRSREVWAVV